MLKLKVCGMKYPQNIREISALVPDYMGFIKYDQSPRNFNCSIPPLDPTIKKTGVFVDATLDNIVEAIIENQFQAVQLHGEEPPGFCEAVRDQGVEVIKAFSIRDELDLKKIQSYQGKVNFFLFDTYGKAKGGNGVSFNWELIKDYSLETPFFLSGGIGLKEAEKIRQLFEYFVQSNKQHLFYAIDVNSKFESKPGYKKINELKEFRKNLSNYVV